MIRRELEILILVANGPNINMLEYRDKNIYGHISENEIRRELESRAQKDENKIIWWQGNSQGEIIDFLQNNYKSADGLIINPAAYSHTSMALKDCLDMLEIPVIEVHISNPIIRQRNLLTAAAVDAVIMGMGINSYISAYNYLLNII